MIDPKYAVHGATLSFAWFFVCNLVVSLLVTFCARGALKRGGAANPQWWLALRLAPAVASAFFVCGVFVPSYWKYEPRESVEGFDLTLTVIALLAAFLIAASALRGLRAWRSAARRVGRWVQHGRLLPHATGAWATPVFIVDSDRPLIALSGVRRHRLLVTRGLVEALTAAELTAAIAHELGHRRAWDNFKRLMMRSAPDFLRLTSAAQELEHRWASAAEHVADNAAGRAPTARCAMASALVKVARLNSCDGQERAMVAEPISTLIGGGEIASRVQRLLDDREPADPPRSRRPLYGMLTAAVLLGMTYAPLLRAVHETTERLIRILP